MSAVTYPSSRPTSLPRERGPRFGVPEAAFVGLLVLGAALVMLQTRGLSFFGDEWDFVVDRRGMSAGVLLTPHGPHLSLIPILIYKLLLQLFGQSSYLPFRLLAAFDLVVMAAALGLICRRLWGPWWALAPVLLLVTLGPGSITLLWPFQVGYAISTAAGVFALVALLPGDRRLDALACALLIVALASASQGIGFVVGAAVIIALRFDWRSRAWPVLLSRAWVVAVPVVLYGLWYLKYGHQHSETHPSLWKNALPYEVQALAATLAPLAGLSSVGPTTGILDITFGVPMALAVIAAVAYALWRGWRAPALFWAGVATLAVLWLASCLSNIGARPPNEPRYLAPDAVVLLICLFVAVRRPRLRRGGIVAVALGLAVIAATNAAQYDQTRQFLRSSDVISQAELGALNLLRGVVPPSFTPEQPGDPGVLVNVTAGPYFSAVDSFGQFGDSPAKLAAQSEDTRERADRVLAEGDLSLAPQSTATAPASRPLEIVSGSAHRAGSCLTLGSEPLVIRADPGKYQIAAGKGTPVTIAMARFATAFAFPLGTVKPGTTAIAPVRADRAPSVPWRMQLSGAGGRICSVAV